MTRERVLGSTLPPAVRRPGRPRVAKRAFVMGLSTKVREAVELMVFGGPAGVPMTRAEAAAAVGLKDKTLRVAFRNPVVVAHYNAELEALRLGERARNLHVAAGIRDDPQMAESAAGNKVRIEAARFIEGRDGGVRVDVAVGVQNIQPGYVVKIPEGMIDVTPAGPTAPILDHVPRQWAKE